MSRGMENSKRNRKAVMPAMRKHQSCATRMVQMYASLRRKIAANQLVNPDGLCMTLLGKRSAEQGVEFREARRWLSAISFQPSAKSAAETGQGSGPVV